MFKNSYRLILGHLIPISLDISSFVFHLRFRSKPQVVCDLFVVFCSILLKRHLIADFSRNLIIIFRQNKLRCQFRQFQRQSKSHFCGFQTRFSNFLQIRAFFAGAKINDWSLRRNYLYLLFLRTRTANRNYVYFDAMMDHIQYLLFVRTRMNVLRVRIYERIYIPDWKAEHGQILLLGMICIHLPTLPSPPL